MDKKYFFSKRQVRLGSETFFIMSHLIYDHNVSGSIQ